MNWSFLHDGNLVMMIIALGLTSLAGAADELIAPPPDEILKTLKPTHPRLIIDESTITRVKGLIRTEPHVGRWYEKIKSDADKILKQPASKYEIPDGRRLLSVSRRVKGRIQVLSLVYHIERDQSYLERAWTELQAAASFKDWNPSHFLDTAEMTHAFAIAYDWLYESWSDEQRRIIREAIVKQGLNPAMSVYRKGRGWPSGYNNWNQVCNGGIGLGALAIADEEPQLAAEILHEGIKSIPIAMRHFAPDGAGTEGVTYWDYGARYNVLFLSALETALGGDFGLSDIESFALSGDYPIYMAGADRMAFNFSDCGLRRTSSSQHFWMGRKYNKPHYSWYRYSELKHPGSNGGVLDLIWFDDSVKHYDVSGLLLDKYFREAECVSMRSSWDDPDALVVGFQAGQNRNLGGHRHLDLGSFILEAQGERWVIDLGSERQTYMRHRHSHQKWEFYRIRAEGHNTLVINPGEGPDQELKASAKIVRFESTPDRAVAATDLSEAYAGHARRVQRTISMIDRSRVAITDEIEADEPAEVWWFMHTRADLSLSSDKTVATLSQNGKSIKARIVAGPDEAVFSVMDADPLPTSPDPEQQASNEGHRKLAIRLTGMKQLKLTVEIGPE